MESGTPFDWEGAVEKGQSPKSWLSTVLGLDSHQFVQTMLSLFYLYVTTHTTRPYHSLINHGLQSHGGNYSVGSVKKSLLILHLHTKIHEEKPKPVKFRLSFILTVILIQLVLFLNSCSVTSEPVSSLFVMDLSRTLWLRSSDLA